MGPLKGYKVVEMAGLAPGPFAAMMLADMGADVLCIERPQLTSAGAPKDDPRLKLLNRNRRSIALDLKSSAGVATLCRDRKSTRLNSSHVLRSRMPSSA